MKLSKIKYFGKPYHVQWNGYKLKEGSVVSK